MDLNDLSTRGLIKLVLGALDRQEAVLSELSASFSRLSTAVEGMRSDYESRLTTVQEALDAERAEADRLAEAEAIEDVNQDQALADARAASDAAIADAQAVSDQMSALADQLSDAQASDSGGGSAGGDTGGTDTPVDTGDAGNGGQPAPVDTGALPADDTGDVAVPVDDSQNLVTDQNEGPAADAPTPGPEDETTV